MKAIESPIRVVLVDRRTLMRDCLPTVLHARGIEVVGVVSRIDDVDDVRAPFDLILTNVAADAAHCSGARVVVYDNSTVPATLAALCDNSELPPATSSTRCLTRREIDVMRGIADGLSSLEIAATLDIAPKSVENHTQRIFAKLRVRSRAHAVMVSLTDGLLEPSAAVGAGACGSTR